jgi:hypothetical protein
VIEIFPLEQDAGSTRVLRQTRSFEHRRGPTGVVALQPVELGEKLAVASNLVVLGGDLFDDAHQRFRYETSAVDSEMAADVGIVRATVGQPQARPRKIAAFGKRCR